MFSFLNIITFASNVNNNIKKKLCAFLYIILFSNAFPSNLAPTSAAKVIQKVCPESSWAQHYLGNGLILWLINKNFVISSDNYKGCLC